MSVEIKHRNGGVTIVHDLSVLDDILKADRKFNAASDAFHAKLMAMGVKAYRCNDGWVDRENHIVTFFADEREPGYYWGNRNLKNGDKIFLRGNDDSGQFALVDRVVKIGSYSVRYHYILTDEFLDKDGIFHNSLTTPPKVNHKKFRRMINRITERFISTKQKKNR